MNAGDPAELDLDGSASDIGMYGGDGGDGFDLDGDSYPDYFWPGGITDAPPGFSSSAYDRGDLDPMTH